MSKPFYFEDHLVGDCIECDLYDVRGTEIKTFASKWDPQPWHTDEEAAKKSMFGGLTACSAHIFSIYCITSQNWQNGYVQQAVAGLGFDEQKMLAPVYAGDALRCITWIDGARSSKSKPDCGIVTYRSELKNQHDASVFSIKCSTLMARRPGQGN